MQRDKHKRKVSHVILVTSDATDGDVKQFRIRSQSLWLVLVALCIVVGAMIGYMIYEERIWQMVGNRSDELQAQIQSLTEENERLKEDKLSLETQISGLNETVEILSETVSEKTKREEELLAQMESQSMPTEFPLNGSASMEESAEGNPACIFTASPGTMVVATANGTVTGVNDDVEYGHNIWVDHGNGYVTIYRNAGEPQVEAGDTVVGGTPLFVIEEGKEKLGYQMMKDGTYIDPMEMLSISG